MAKIQKINDFVNRRCRTNESANYNYKKQIEEWFTSICREDNDVEHICITTRSIFDSLYDSLGAAAMNRLAMPNDSHWESMLRPNSGDDYILVLTGPSGYLNSDRKVSLVKNTEKYIIIVLEEGDSIDVICDNPSNLSAIKARSLVVMPEGMNEGLEPRSNGRDWSKIYSEIDVLKYVCENLPNKIKVAVAKFSNLQKNNQYSPYNEYVGINGVSYDSEGYWLNLEDDSRYSLGMVMQDLKKGKNLNEIFTLN